MLQAAVLDCQFLDPFPFSDDGFVPTEVDICRCDVAQTFLTFKVAGQIIVFQQHAIFQGLKAGRTDDPNASRLSSSSGKSVKNSAGWQLPAA